MEILFGIKLVVEDHVFRNTKECYILSIHEGDTVTYNPYKEFI